MKKEKYILELECLMQDEVQNPNGLHHGNLILDGNKGSFVEAAPSRPHTRNPKPLDGKIISLVQNGINDFVLGIKTFNPFFDNSPLATIDNFRAESMQAWNIAHGKV